MGQRQPYEGSRSLNRVVLIASLLIGPVLALSFWVILGTGSSYLYREWDQRNGWVEVVTAVVSLCLTVAIILALTRKQRSWIINYGSAGLWLLTTLFLGWAAWYDLVVTDWHRCYDQHCMYELGVVVWWALTLIHWMSLLAFTVVAGFRRWHTPSQPRHQT